MKNNEASFPVHKFRYDQSLGVVRLEGSKCGTVTAKGYRRIKASGLRVAEHRLAWRLVHGQWPTFEIDRMDRNRLNNRIENLRPATHAQNACNIQSSRNTSGEKNVVLMRNCNSWAVKIKSGALLVHSLASHKLSAILAARLIRRTLHGEFAA